MRSNLSKYYFLIPIIPFIYSLFFSTYIYDGYHYGLMFSNALDLNNGKLPYKEIFIEYGYLTTLIHSIIIKILGNEVYFLQVYTALIYSITLSVISVIIKKLTNNYYAFFSIISLILIYPIPLKPWAIYNSYLFYSLAIFFILDLKKKNLFISGLLIGLSYLSFTTLYNFIVIPLVLLILLYFYIFKREE